MLIDPAVSSVWAEADFANFTVYIPEIPDAMLAAYREINPLPDGLEVRLALIRVHDWLQIIEHTDDMPDFQARAVAGVRAAIERFT